MGNPVCALLKLYIYLVIGRVILSWFPITPGSGLASVYRVVHTLTEPVLGPVRRIVPALGMIDISPLVVIILAELLLGRVC